MFFMGVMLLRRLVDAELSRIDTEYDRAKVPPYNGNDPRLPLVV